MSVLVDIVDVLCARACPYIVVYCSSHFKAQFQFLVLSVLLSSPSTPSSLFFPSPPSLLSSPPLFPHPPSSPLPPPPPSLLLPPPSSPLPPPPSLLLPSLPLPSLHSTLPEFLRGLVYLPSRRTLTSSRRQCPRGLYKWQLPTTREPLSSPTTRNTCLSPAMEDRPGYRFRSRQASSMRQRTCTSAMCPLIT